LEEEEVKKINEDTAFTIPLKNLIALVFITGISVTTYFQVDQRLQSLEFKQDIIWKKATEHEEWIDGFQLNPYVREARAIRNRLAIEQAIIKEKLDRLYGEESQDDIP